MSAVWEVMHGAAYPETALSFLCFLVQKTNMFLHRLGVCESVDKVFYI